MIKIVHAHGCTCPYLHCDACGERIDNCDEGMVQILGNDTVRIVHKEYVRAGCDDKKDVGWMELGHFLVYVQANLNITTKQAKRYKEDAAMLQNI